MEDNWKGELEFPPMAQSQLPNSEFWSWRNGFDIIHHFHFHLITTISSPVHPPNIGFSFFWMIDSKDYSDHWAWLGYFPVEHFTHMVYSIHSSISKTEQITRDSQGAKLTNISLPGNESMLDIWTIIVIANNYAKLYRPVCCHMCLWGSAIWKHCEALGVWIGAGDRCL